MSDSGAGTTAKTVAQDVRELLELEFERGGCSMRGIDPPREQERTYLEKKRTVFEAIMVLADKAGDTQTKGEAEEGWSAACAAVARHRYGEPED